MTAQHRQELVEYNEWKQTESMEDKLSYELWMAQFGKDKRARLLSSIPDGKL